jgi:hypothetical protein
MVLLRRRAIRRDRLLFDPGELTIKLSQLSSHVSHRWISKFVLQMGVPLLKLTKKEWKILEIQSRHRSVHAAAQEHSPGNPHARLRIQRVVKKARRLLEEIVLKAVAIRYCRLNLHRMLRRLGNRSSPPDFE